MHAADTMRYWMHYLHDEGVKAVHHTENMFRAKRFWIILGFLAVIAGIFMLGALFGNYVAPPMTYPYFVPVP